MADTGGSLPYFLMWTWLAGLLATVLVMCGKKKAATGEGVVASTQKTTQDDDKRSVSITGSKTISSRDEQRCPRLTFDEPSPVVVSPLVKPPVPEVTAKEHTEQPSSGMVDSQGNKYYINERGETLRPEANDETLDMIRTNFGHTQSVGQKDPSTGGSGVPTAGDSNVPTIPSGPEKSKRPVPERPRTNVVREKEKERVRDPDRVRRSGGKKHGDRKSHGGKNRHKKSRESNKKRSRYEDEESDEERSGKGGDSRRDEKGYEEWKKSRIRKRADKERKRKLKEEKQKKEEKSEKKEENTEKEKKIEQKTEKEKKEEGKTEKEKKEGEEKPLEPTQTQSGKSAET